MTTARPLLIPAAAALALVAGPTLAVEATGTQVYPVRLSGWCEPVTSDRARTSRDGGVFRVRSGGTLTASANRQTIMVEEGGSLAYVGRGSSIYVENGAFARIVGDANTVIMQPRAKLSASGANYVSVVGSFEVKLNRNADNCK